MKVRLPQFFIRFIWLALSLGGIGLGVVVLYIINIPDVTIIRSCFRTTMFQIDLCPTSKSYVHLKDISPKVSQAIIASEDGAFYSHSGFDWFEIQSAFKSNVDGNGRSRGASTITQQLAKNLFLSADRTLSRKLREAYITLQIERNFTKDEILEKYLNVIEFGPNLYGVKAASQHYFNKHPRDLNVLEGAYLASLLPNPKAYSLTFRRRKLDKYSRHKIDLILRRLHRFQKISTTELNWAQQNIDLFPWHGLSPFSESPILAEDSQDEAEHIEPTTSDESEFIPPQDSEEENSEDPAAEKEEAETPDSDELEPFGLNQQPTLQRKFWTNVDDSPSSTA